MVIGVSEQTAIVVVALGAFELTKFGWRVVMTAVRPNRENGAFTRDDRDRLVRLEVRSEAMAETLHGIHDDITSVTDRVLAVERNCARWGHEGKE